MDERVYPDESLWVECVKKAHIFFRTAILLEVIGKWFHDHRRGLNQMLCLCDQDHPQVVLTSTVTAEVQKVGKGSRVTMHLVPYVWFHFHCLKLHGPPHCKRWYCPDYRKLPNFKKRKGNI